MVINTLVKCLLIVPPDEEWGNISTEAKELIKKMLRRNPKNRISAKEALQDK